MHDIICKYTKRRAPSNFSVLVHSTVILLIRATDVNLLRNESIVVHLEQILCSDKAIINIIVNSYVKKF